MAAKVQNPGQVNFYGGPHIRKMAPRVAKLGGFKTISEAMRFAFYKLALDVDPDFAITDVPSAHLRERLAGKEGGR